MGGEKLLAMKSRATFWGSPPRRQGKANWHCVRRPALRITPAHAGKRQLQNILFSMTRDHPRMGGEKSFSISSTYCATGSPPRGRGKDFHELHGVLLAGITPAWAGKSLTGSETAAYCRDHPRVGGEKSLLFAASRASVGSPPRWRGKARHLSHGLLPCG